MKVGVALKTLKSVWCYKSESMKERHQDTPGGYERGLLSSNSSSASGSSIILSLKPAAVVSAATFASFLRLAESFSFSHRSRNLAIISFCNNAISNGTSKHVQLTFLSLSTFVSLSSSSSSLIRLAYCASLPVLNPGIGTAGTFALLNSSGGAGRGNTAELPKARWAFMGDYRKITIFNKSGLPPALLGICYPVVVGLGPSEALILVLFPPVGSST
jgi:hypothetical protein